jgi:thiamine biosynthesis lipoprotein
MASATTTGRRFEGRAMASGLSLTVDGCDATTATVAWAAVLDEFSRTEAAMSRFLATSEVSTLNRAALAGAPFAPTRRLAAAVQTCERARRLTDGRFDPRIIDTLERIGYRGAPLDGAAAPVVSRERPIARRLDRARIRLDHPIDLGGIGKGLALRWAADRVSAAGVSRFLLDAGGDIVAGVTSPMDRRWQVGIEDPSGDPEPRAVVDLGGGAVATSSIRRLRWVAADGPVHHLVDPSTDRPADGGLAAVTVAGPDPAWAEVWSKALFVAGRRRIADVARARGLAAWWIAVDGTLEMTPAARTRTTWVAGEP